MKKLLSIFLTLLTLTSFGTESLQEGAYIGKLNNVDKVTLILQAVPGRESSFFGLLMKDEITEGKAQISIYLIDVSKAQTYTMIPLEVTHDGEIGIKNDHPSLVLQIVVDKMKITSAQSSNKRGFNGHMTFSLKRPSRKWEWTTVVEGDYGDALSISRFDPIEAEATAVFATQSLNGHFIVREKFPLMYTVHANVISNSGAEAKQIPRAIGVFLTRRAFGRKFFFFSHQS